jgi:hypothetical protein
MRVAARAPGRGPGWPRTLQQRNRARAGNQRGNGQTSRTQHPDKAWSEEPVWNSIGLRQAAANERNSTARKLKIHLTSLEAPVRRRRLASSDGQAAAAVLTGILGAVVLLG